ncbi:hypothetical protein PLICRDRAFT_392866 [Plicaturopsis crispa FD-325 SS-3]|nr:hypothetical protein PLICRDRAFT_392866 [Plicaturopsis crispa FD-325 SS-3]
MKTLTSSDLLSEFCYRFHIADGIDIMLVRRDCKMQVVGDAYILDPTYIETCFFVQPCFWYSGGERYSKQPFQRWKNMQKHKHELVARLSNKWYYLGTYSITSTTVLAPATFDALPSKVRQEVYHETTSNTTRKIVKAELLEQSYSLGELTSVRIDMHRVGFDSNIYQALLGLPINAV